MGEIFYCVMELLPELWVYIRIFHQVQELCTILSCMQNINFRYVTWCGSSNHHCTYIMENVQNAEVTYLCWCATVEVSEGSSLIQGVPYQHLHLLGSNKQSRWSRAEGPGKAS